MLDRLSNMSVEDIKNGFTFDTQTGRYTCSVCSREFEKGEIFKCGDRYYDADKMARVHVSEEHANILEILCSNDKKYTGLTDNHKELLGMMYSGMSDNEIAKKTGVAAATIRHQRFVFRERAKQAKLYLAIYELALQGGGSKKLPDKSDEIIDVHKGAKMVDDRYFTTKEEERKIIETMFSSLAPLKLKTFSSKEKKKLVILRKIAEQFNKDRHYSEKELNAVIKDIYEDFATIRRYLIEYGFMERTKDCKEYWLK